MVAAREAVAETEAARYGTRMADVVGEATQEEAMETAVERAVAAAVKGPGGGGDGVSCPELGDSLQSPRGQRASVTAGSEYTVLL